MQSFENLKVWEKPHILTIDVFRSRNPFPCDEIYGLTFLQIGAVACCRDRIRASFKNKVIH